MENISEPSDHIPAVLERVNKQYMCKTYQVLEWSDSTDFLEKLALRTGRLLKVSDVFMFAVYITSDR